MNLHEYIDQLQLLEKKKNALETLIKSWVKITIHEGYCHLGIIYEESDMLTENYSMDYDTIGDVIKAISSFIDGAMLAKHMEI